MSGTDDDSDKQYEPSQKKLDDARAKGEIAKSADLTTAAGYGGFLLAAVAFGPVAVIGFGTGLQILLGQSDRLSADLFAGSPTPFIGGISWQILASIWPFFALPSVLAVLSVLAQQAFVFAPTKLQPKLSRISPLSTAKNKFGRTGLFEFLKSFVKLLIYSTVMGIFLSAQRDRIIASMYLPAPMIGAELARMLVQLMLLVLTIAVILGAIDLTWQRAEHHRKHKMSRKELMDEMKQSEGDPAMKQQRRAKGMSLAMNKMLADVPQADVVIVNPTHYAVALTWDRMNGAAPACVAKGQDEVAARIREIAIENGVPLHSDPPTARALHATIDIGQEVQADHYRAVAAAIRFAEAMRKKVQT